MLPSWSTQMRSLTVHQLEVLAERVDPEAIEEFGIADRDVSRYALGEMEATHGAQAAGEALLAVQALSFEVGGIGAGLLFELRTGFPRRCRSSVLQRVAHADANNGLMVVGAEEGKTLGATLRVRPGRCERRRSTRSIWSRSCTATPTRTSAMPTMIDGRRAAGRARSSRSADAVTGRSARSSEKAADRDPAHRELVDAVADRVREDADEATGTA